MVHDEDKVGYDIGVLILVGVVLKLLHLFIIYRVYYSRSQPRAAKT